MHLESLRVYAVHVRPGEGQTAEQTGGDVVGMTLDLRGECERGRIVESLGAAGDQRASGDDSGDDGSGGRSQPAPVRDAVGAHELQTRRAAAEPVESRAHRPDDEVARVARDGGRPHAGHVDGQT